MRKTKSILLIVLSAIMLVSLSLFAACNPTNTGDSSNTDGQSYTLTFVTNGGNELEPLTVKAGETVTLPKPLKGGYVFDGWFSDSELKNAVSDNYQVSGNATFYAKWAEGVTVTLNLNGGSLETTSLTIKKGDRIADKLANLIPTYEHHEFDAWLDGQAVLSSGKTATEDITLVARYKVEISVQIYEQNLELDGYTLAETVRVYALEGTSYEYKEAHTGFKAVANENALTKLTVNADYTKNVLRAYFDRNRLTVTFNSNFPAEANLENINETVENVLYGSRIKAIDEYTCDGFILVGYSDSANGSVVYPVNGYKKNLFNGESGDFEEAEITVEKTQVLYGVWVKGYIDMFRGQDSIFYFEGSNEVYLSRGGVMFKGEYTGKDNKFEFRDKDGELLLRGRLFENHTFCYQDESRAEVSRMNFESGVGANPEMVMHLDEYNGIRLVVTQGKTVIEESDGYFEFDDEAGDNIAYFTSGAREGESFRFITGYANYSGGTVAAFQIKNEEDAELGVLPYFGVVNGAWVRYNVNQIAFNGYGTAAINTGTTVAAYYYTFNRNNNSFVLMSGSSSSSQLSFKIVEVDGVKGYAQYNSSFDRTVIVRPGEDDAQSLQMDGVGNAVYTNGASKISGIYSVESSTLYQNNYIITLYAGDKTLKFVTGTETYEVQSQAPGADGSQTQQAQRAIVTQKDSGYAEYRYLYGNSVYRMLFVLNEPSKDKASIYLINNSTYVLAAVGSYTYDSGTGRYKFTLDELKNTETELDSTMLPKELNNIKSFEFGLENASLSNYYVHYWYSYTDNTDAETKLEEVYTCDKDNSKLTLVANIIGIYEYNSNTYYTLCITNSDTNITTLSTPQGTVAVIELDKENHKFVKYEYAPYNIYLVDSQGKYSRNKYIALDGKGGAVLTYVDETDSKVKTEYKGTYALTDDTTSFGSPISAFTADGADSDKNMRLIVIGPSSGNYYGYVEDKTYKTEYRSEAGMLTLDGFYYLASYTTAEGTRYLGVYTSPEENVISLGVLSQSYSILGYYYFDINGEDFTVRGSEYATYIFFENSMPSSLYVSFDGYGKAEVFTYETVTDDTGNQTSQRKDIDLEATYVKNNNEITLTYKDEKEVEHTVIGVRGVFTYSNKSYNAFFIIHKEVSLTYVNGGEWYVMVVDEIGNATIYNERGVAETGMVTIINEYLMYFVNSAQTDACVYKYDTENGIVEKIKYRDPFGYYTEDLESLLFTQYGFAVFNNETRYYYERENENVFIYHYEPENENANDYGFVKEEFGEFTDVKDYNGLTYYKNDGYPINFERKEDNKDKFPVQVSQDEKYPVDRLMFAPNGEDEFSVSGYVFINDQRYSCTVVRELDENGEYNMYVYVNPFRLYITINYTGVKEDGTSNNYFEITSMTRELSALSAVYLQQAVFDYFFTGSMGENTVGEISLKTVYDEQGTAQSTKINATFYENSRLYDMTEKLVELKDADCVWSSSSVMVDYKSDDGNDYKLYISLSANSLFGVNQYVLVAFTRIQTMDVADYKVKTERIVYTEVKDYKQGQLVGAELLDKEGNKIDLDETYVKDGVVYGLAHTYEQVEKEGSDTTVNGKILTSKLYTITLTEKEDEVAGGDGSPEGDGEASESKPVIPALAVKLYESATVSVDNLEVLYDSDDERSWIERKSDGTLVKFVYDVYADNYFMPENVEKNEQNTEYTITVYDGTVFTVKIDGETVEIVRKSGPTA